MSSKTSHGKRAARRSDKCKAPKGASPSTLLSIADRCAKTYKFHQKLDGLKYKAIAFWEVIVYAVLFSLGLEDASNRLNKIKIAEANKKLRRKKAPKELRAHVSNSARRPARLGMPLMAVASVPLVPRVDTVTASHDACLAPVRCKVYK